MEGVSCYTVGDEVTNKLSMLFCEDEETAKAPAETKGTYSSSSGRRPSGQSHPPSFLPTLVKHAPRGSSLPPTHPPHIYAQTARNLPG